MPEQAQQFEVIPAELLSLTAAKIGGKPHVVLNFRYTVDGERRNMPPLAITKNQVKRLRDDLDDILKYSPMFQET